MQFAQTPAYLGIKQQYKEGDVYTSHKFQWPFHVALYSRSAVTRTGLLLSFEQIQGTSIKRMNHGIIARVVEIHDVKTTPLLYHSVYLGTLDNPLMALYKAHLF